MAKKQPRDEPTQKTQPRGKDAQGRPAKPVTIPVPTRGEVERDLDKLMGKRPAPDRERKD